MSLSTYPPSLDVLDLCSSTPVLGATTMRPVDGPDVDVVSAPTDRWPFEDDSLDRIDARCSLENLSSEEVAHVFSEARRTLRPFGVFEGVVRLDGYLSSTADPDYRTGWYWDTPECCLARAGVDTDERGPLRLVERNLVLSLPSSGDSAAASCASGLLRGLSRYDERLYRLCDLSFVEGRLTFVLRKGPARRTVVTSGRRTSPA